MIWRMLIIYVLVLIAIIGGIGSLFGSIHVNKRGLFNLLSLVGVILLIVLLYTPTKEYFIHNNYDNIIIIIGVVISYIGILKTIIKYLSAYR